jgi:YHS domain-containing protein
MKVNSILSIIIFSGLFYLMMRRGGGCGMGHGGHGGHGSGDDGQGRHSNHEEGSGSGGSRMIKDPVCGVFVDLQISISSKHMGQNFYFCSPACKENFDKEPMKYIKKEQCC